MGRAYLHLGDHATAENVGCGEEQKRFEKKVGSELL